MSHFFPAFAVLAVSPESPAHLPLTLLLVFGTAKLFSELLERFGQPGLIGEIFAGLLIGPSCLQWIKPDAVLTALSELGVMFLLFRVGLEVKPSELFRVGRTALLVAFAGVALPFAVGWLTMASAGTSRIEALFVGATTVATSVGITAQVLASKGWLGERASKIILAAAVIDDVLGLLVLSVVTSVAQKDFHVANLVGTGVMAVVFTLFIARFGSRALHRVVPRIEERLSVQEARFHLALIVLFGLSLMAVYIGIAAIVGAFLAGLAFSETAGSRVTDMAHGINELLLPFFFAGIGLQLQLADFRSSRILILSLLVTLGAVLSKLIGCGVGALAFGPKDALRVGIGMMPRGEVGMVVAQVGLALGVIEKPVYAVVVFMAVATTLLAPPLLKLAYRGCGKQAVDEEFSLA